MQGSIEINILSTFDKVFTYGALVWLAVRAGCHWSIATTVGAALVFCVRLCQFYLPGRSAEITDVIILLMVAGTMKLMSERPADGRSIGNSAVTAPRRR